MVQVLGDDGITYGITVSQYYSIDIMVWLYYILSIAVLGSS